VDFYFVLLLFTFSQPLARGKQNGNEGEVQEERISTVKVNLLKAVSFFKLVVAIFCLGYLIFC